MQLNQVMTLIEGRPVSANLNPQATVSAGFAADLMSDALRYDLSGALLISGLATSQVVRTAEMADVAAILLVRGKTPLPETVDLADELGIAFMRTAADDVRDVRPSAGRGPAACKPYTSQT